MIIACVRTGDKYAPEYVYRLKRGAERHLSVAHRFVCLTDRPGDLQGVETVRTPAGVGGWWAKMMLFDPKWRDGESLVYFDLDTVLVRDIKPLVDLNVQFGICENFTRRAGQTTWPCHYGSCVMAIAKDWGGMIWSTFWKRRHELMRDRHGDQMVIEHLCREIGCRPTFLQDVLPAGFFVGYRELPRHRDKQPDTAAVIVFAGQHKPHNTECDWARKAWAA